MKLIMFTTCKPFIGDDAWRQEQAIKSWCLLKGIDIKIIVIGNDKGVKELCEKYKLIHEPGVKTLEGVPYLDDMFEIAERYSNENDIMMWTNSDMIYFDHMIQIIKDFLNKYNEKTENYILVGRRIDWFNPIILEEFSYEKFNKNINFNEYKNILVQKTDSEKYECAVHPECGIDYVIYNPGFYKDKIDKNLVIAGTRHDMILVGVGVNDKNCMSVNIGNQNHCIHQNHGYGYKDISNILKSNNNRCYGNQLYITECKYNIDSL